MFALLIQTNLSLKKRGNEETLVSVVPEGSDTPLDVEAILHEWTLPENQSR
jgi:hypothetical protein